MEWQAIVGVGGFFITVGGLIYGVGKMVGWLNGKFESQDKVITTFMKTEEERRKEWQRVMETQMLPECRQEFQAVRKGIGTLSTTVGELKGKVDTILKFVSNGNYPEDTEESDSPE
jgi:hypothetical protein